MAGDFNTDFNGDFSRVPYQGTLAGELTFRCEVAAVHGVSGILAGEVIFNADFEGRTVRRRRPSEGGGGRKPPIVYPVPPKLEPTPVKFDPVVGRLNAELTFVASFAALALKPAPRSATMPLPSPARASLAGQVLLDAEFIGVHSIDAGLNDDEDILLLLQAA